MKTLITLATLLIATNAFAGNVNASKALIAKTMSTSFEGVSYAPVSRGVIAIKTAKGTCIVKSIKKEWSSLSAEFIIDETSFIAIETCVENN